MTPKTRERGIGSNLDLSPEESLKMIRELTKVKLIRVRKLV